MCNKKINNSKKALKFAYFCNCLDRLGISKQYMAYKMLVGMLNIAINKGANLNNFSKNIYPALALEFGVSLCAIERNVRVLINKSWNAELIIKLKPYVSKVDRPTCCQFVVAIKDYVMAKIS